MAGHAFSYSTWKAEASLVYIVFSQASLAYFVKSCLIAKTSKQVDRHKTDGHEPAWQFPPRVLAVSPWWSARFTHRL